MRITVPIVVKMDMDDIIERLKKDDFVRVVRCKDCKWRTENECRLLEERDPNTDHRIWRGFFCAYGEVV